MEVEQRNGFDVRSVYQAHEQGRGANYSWVFAHSDDSDARVATAAAELGVGVVVFTNPGSYGTYKMTNKATFKPAGRDAREQFLARCGVPDYY